MVITHAGGLGYLKSAVVMATATLLVQIYPTASGVFNLVTRWQYYSVYAFVALALIAAFFWSLTRSQVRVVSRWVGGITSWGMKRYETMAGSIFGCGVVVLCVHVVEMGQSQLLPSVALGGLVSLTTLGPLWMYEQVQTLPRNNIT